jgi:hypothetical protein
LINFYYNLKINILMADNESKEIIKNREKQLRDMAEIIADLN